MKTLKMIIVLICCHLIGDYTFQSDFIANRKGNNWYYLVVHCVLYCLPFLIFFDLTWQISIIFITHLIIDALKARYHKINCITDQTLHYIVMLVYLL